MNANSACSYKGKSRLQSIALKIIKISHSRSIYGREWRKTWWHDGDFKLFSINALKHSNDTKRQQYFAWFNCAWFFFRGKLLVHSPFLADFFRYMFSYHDGDGIVVQCENVFICEERKNLNFLHAMSNVFDFISFLFYFLTLVTH